MEDKPQSRVSTVNSEIPFQAKIVVIGGEPILHMGEIVGLTTSGAFGHSLGRGIALGYVRTEGRDVHDMIKVGCFEIEIACQRFPAEAFLRAAYDPNGERMKNGA